MGLKMCTLKPVNLNFCFSKVKGKLKSLLCHVIKGLRTETKVFYCDSIHCPQNQAVTSTEEKNQSYKEQRLSALLSTLRKVKDLFWP